MEQEIDKSIVNFENSPVRRVWDEEKEQWFFAIVDVVAVLSESSNPAGYIRDMRRRDKDISTGWGQENINFKGGGKNHSPLV